MTYIFIIYNLNKFVSNISISVHSTLFNLWFFSYIGVILHPYCVIPMYVCTNMHVCIMSTKSGLIKIVHTKIVMVYIVEITRISAFHRYMTCPTFFFLLSFCV